MGITIGGDAATSGNNTNLLVVMHVSLSQKMVLLDLTNRTQFKKVNGYKIHTKIVRNYWGMCVILNTGSIFYWHTNVNLMGGCQVK